MKKSENTIKLTIPEEQLWENLKISNDFMFAKVMRNPELCKGMLERLLGIKKKILSITLKFKPAGTGTFPKEPDIILA